MKFINFLVGILNALHIKWQMKGLERRIGEIDAILAEDREIRTPGNWLINFYEGVEPMSQDEKAQLREERHEAFLKLEELEAMLEELSAVAA